MPLGTIYLTIAIVWLVAYLVVTFHGLGKLLVDYLIATTMFFVIGALVFLMHH